MRYRRRQHPLAIPAFLLVLVLLIGGVVAMDAQLRPLIQSYGYMAARRGAMLAVHTAVEKVMTTRNVAYDELVDIQRDEEGHIVSVSADTASVNRLKAQITTAVTDELGKREVTTARIPLGSVFGGSLLTGRGPFLPIHVHTSGAVVSQLVSEFTDAGINQTRHRITLCVTVFMTAALPAERVAIELTTDFAVCETIVVGHIPQTVMQVDFGENMRRIFGSGD